MSRNICEAKMNQFIANEKANAIIDQFLSGKSASDNQVVSQRVQLKKIMLRVPAFGNQPQQPFYGFIKPVGKLAAIVDVKSGSGLIFDGSQIAAETNVNGNFRIDGVTYGKKDTMNGFIRYHAVAIPRKQRRKLRLNSPEVVSALYELNSPWNQHRTVPQTEEIDF